MKSLTLPSTHLPPTIKDIGDAIQACILFQACSSKRVWEGSCRCPDKMVDHVMAMVNWVDGKEGADGILIMCHSYMYYMMRKAHPSLFDMTESSSAKGFYGTLMDFPLYAHPSFQSGLLCVGSWKEPGDPLRYCVFDSHGRTKEPLFWMEP
jgi:hypothetical protein